MWDGAPPPSHVPGHNPGEAEASYDPGEADVELKSATDEQHALFGYDVFIAMIEQLREELLLKK